MTYEYVISATTMFGLNYIRESVPIVNRYLKDMGDMSFLFNAFYEAEIGIDYKKQQFSPKRIFSDSGGLQIVSLNLDSASVAKERENVYRIQAEYSDIAMNFDEMAVRNLDDKGGIGKNNYRYFIEDQCVPAAMNTVDNIKRQIEVFDEMDATTKLMLIGQGNCIDTFNKYLSTIIFNLSDYEVSRIHGLAPAFSSIGGGELQTFDVLYGISTFNIPDRLKQNIHLLGIGSSRRMLPLIYSKDYFSFVKNVSFDSTSDSRKYLLSGYLTSKTKTMPKSEYILKDVIKEYDVIYQEFKQYIDQHPDWKGVEDFVRNYTYYADSNTKKVWRYGCGFKHTDLGALFIFFITMHFVRMTMRTIYEPDDISIRTIMEDVRTYSDYQKVRPHLNMLYNLKNEQIKRVKSTDGFKRVDIKRGIL